MEKILLVQEENLRQGKRMVKSTYLMIPSLMSGLLARGVDKNILRAHYINYACQTLKARSLYCKKRKLLEVS